jgi:hypothetical protein
MRSSLRQLSLLGLLIVFGAMPAPASADTCLGINGKIAVTVEESSRSYIALLGPGNGTLRPLFPAPAAEASFADPSFSCDGTTIAYGGPDFIELADARTGEKIPSHAAGEAAPFPQLPFPVPGLQPNNPTYLSNGKLVFDSPGGPGSPAAGTYVTEPDGSGLRHLFRWEYTAASSDGRWFIAGAAGAFSVRNAKGGEAPWSNLRFGAGANASFSADGGRVTFVRGNDIYVVDTDGSDRQRITHDGRSGNPVFSPNGQWIAFTRSPSSAGPYEEVVAVSLERSPRLRVLARLRYPQIFGELAWSPR